MIYAYAYVYRTIGPLVLLCGSFNCFYCRQEQIEEARSVQQAMMDKAKALPT